ncbi:hypothetical protein [Azoarcus olearius]|uniref:Uncharacterized protein n=1 Tax=Azoarcus sp. (strain BH72) TaxID=418699 RepID=A1KBT5_AZOSB|nr:hypothetical protein [Azoarcus olearius]ANQ86837.1 hypothetical protein dqs_3820 [Azoarcus olearius]CAL96291.1 hypothetical protein predicted by Glimmer/Critica [Azoarcus olearius]
MKMKIRKTANPTPAAERLDPAVVDDFLHTAATALEVKPAAARGRSARTGRKEQPVRSGALALATTLLGLTLSAPALAARGEQYPLIVTPVQTGSGHEEAEQVRVGIFSTSGQRLVQAQVHGRSRVGALPPGEYTVEVSSATGSSIHHVKLGPGQPGIVRYGGPNA